MTETEFNEQIIGQTQLKKKLALYRQAFNRTSVSPFFLFAAARGGGKNHIIRRYVEWLRDQMDRERKLFEVNATSISNIKTFFDIWYPKMRDEKGILFIDEAHELKPKVQSMLLTICEKSRNPVRQYRYEDEGEERTVTFDFREMGIVFATTDHQNMDKALLDRLDLMTIASYTDDELYQIFEMNLGGSLVDNEVRGEIISTFRGHPRSAVQLANQVDDFLLGMGEEIMTLELWEPFLETMGIHEMGFNDTEMLLIKTLGEYGEQSLIDLSAKTDLTRGAIQQEWELYPKKRNLISVSGKRRLTAQGQEFYLRNWVK